MSTSMSTVVARPAGRPARVGALFAGMGGLELAVASVLDAEPAWFSQYDPTTTRQEPSLVLAHHWPDVPNHGDVTSIDWSAVEPVDIITGGFPCQDVSHAGKRAGLRDGTRTGLWSRMRDAIDTIRPRLVIAENVRGLLSAEAASDVEPCAWCMGGAADGEPALRALGAVLGDLADIGYDAAWCGLQAADVGAPHGRFRVFILAWRADDDGALTWRADDDGALLPTPVVNDMGRAYTPDAWDEWTARLKASHGNGNGHGASLHVEMLRLLPTPIVSDANGPGEHGTGGADLRTAVSLLPTPRATDGTKDGPNQRGSSGDLMLPSAVHLLPTPTAEPTTGNGHARNLGAEARSLEPLHDGPDCGEPTRADVFNGVWCACERGTAADLRLLPTPTSTDHKASGSAAYAKTDTHNVGTTLTDATVRQPDAWGQYAPAIARWEAVLGRPAPSPTEPTGKAGAHRLSPRFVEWMQGWPEGWVTDVPGVTRNGALKGLGNGVVPQQAAAALRWLLAVRADAVAGRWAA